MHDSAPIGTTPSLQQQQQQPQQRGFALHLFFVVVKLLICIFSLWFSIAMTRVTWCSTYNLFDAAAPAEGWMERSIECMSVY